MKEGPGHNVTSSCRHPRDQSGLGTTLRGAMGNSERRGLYSLHCIMLELNIYMMEGKLKDIQGLPFILQLLTLALL